MFWVNDILTHNSGFGNSDIDLQNTAESMGLPNTADFFFALISTDELDQLGQILFKQLKNRYDDKTNFRKFVVGLDKSKMTFYDVSPSAQNFTTGGSGGAGGGGHGPQQQAPSKSQKTFTPQNQVPNTGQNLETFEDLDSVQDETPPFEEFKKTDPSEKFKKRFGEWN